MADKLMYIANINTQIYPFFWLQLVVETLDTQLNEQTNQNSKLNKSPQICKANEYWISVMNGQLSPPSLDINRAILWKTHVPRCSCLLSWAQEGNFDDKQNYPSLDYN